MRVQGSLSTRAVTALHSRSMWPALRLAPHRHATHHMKRVAPPAHTTLPWLGGHTDHSDHPARCAARALPTHHTPCHATRPHPPCPHPNTTTTTTPPSTPGHAMHPRNIGAAGHCSHHPALQWLTPSPDQAGLRATRRGKAHPLPRGLPVCARVAGGWDGVRGPLWWGVVVGRAERAWHVSKRATACVNGHTPGHRHTLHTGQVQHVKPKS
jgi:hypothetical protein